MRKHQGVLVPVGKNLTADDNTRIRGLGFYARLVVISSIDVYTGATGRA